MKILTVVYSLGKGGTERAAQNFAFGYSDIGHDSRFLYTRIDGVRREYLEKKKIPVYNLSDGVDCSTLKEWNPDVVHLHSHGISAEDFAKIKNLSPHAKYLETNVFSRPSPWVDDLDLSFQLSHWCDWLYKKRSLKKNPSVVIPNPVDTSSFQFSGDDRVRRFRASHGIKYDDIVIGRVGQHFNGKWSPALIDIYESLRKKTESLKLLIVNPSVSIISRIKESPYCRDIIHIEQIVGDSNLADCYSSIDVFVLIADQGESFGMVLSESLLCNTPVVTLATPWGDNSQGEVVGNGIGGFVAANKKDILGLVDKLIEDKSLRDRMGLAGRNRIIELYDSKKVASDALSSLHSISNCEKAGLLPLDLMRDTDGRLSLLSKLILASERGFFLLRFSTGYQSALQMPIFFAKAAVRRLLRLFGIRKG